MTLTYSDITQKVAIELQPDTIFGMNMSNMRGFKNVVLAELQEADSAVDTTQGIALLYVYMNVVDARIVGYIGVPLLRIELEVVRQRPVRARVVQGVPDD